MKVGIDLLEISRITRLLEDKNSLSKIFRESEMSDNVETLAGIFAAKEAYFKAKGKKGDWLSIEIKKNKNGKPFISSDSSSELSISHDGGYAVAVVIIND